MQWTALRRHAGPPLMVTLARRAAVRKCPLALLRGPLWSVEKRLFRKVDRAPHSLWPRAIGRVPLASRLLLPLRAEAKEMAITALREVEIPDPTTKRGRIILPGEVPRAANPPPCCCPPVKERGLVTVSGLPAGISSIDDH